MKLLVVCALMTVATGAPGLLRVPRVYNAVITSNQNLSPSRAFPVIQPVIHRTAVGYVPPFYYTQVAPHLAGPEVVHYLPGGGGGNAADGKPVVGRDQTQTPSASRLAESTSFGVAKEREDTSGERADAGGGGGAKDEAPARRKNEQLSFYPNYYSLYYEPYVYTYNSFNPHLVPGTYYVDYQPYGEPPLEPIPTNVPKNADSGRLLPGYHDEERDRTKDEKKEKIPDVPPPPLPTSVPKNYAPEDAPDDRRRLRRERMREPRAL